MPLQLSAGETKNEREKCQCSLLDLILRKDEKMSFYEIISTKGKRIACACHYETVSEKLDGCGDVVTCQLLSTVRFQATL